jgi:hypothetical protein
MDQRPARNKKRVSDRDDDMALNAKKRREEEIPLDTLCHQWEEQPLASRPLVFFTVGNVVVLSSSSGVPEVGSLCRQFWTWLGQKPEEYEPSRIVFTMVNGQGLHMSLPDLKCFQVKLKHGPKAPLESVITLSRKLGPYPQKLTAQTIMTRYYTPTPFRTKFWFRGDEVLTDIDAELKLPNDISAGQQPQMFIRAFYSKASDVTTGGSIQDGSEEEKMLRHSGRRLLCQMLDVVQWTHDVVLDASGRSYRDDVMFTAQANLMQGEEILQDLKKNTMQVLTDLNPNLFKQWYDERIENRKKIRAIRGRFNKSVYDDEQEEAAENLASLRTHWVEIRSNQNLVKYYMRTFGFKPVNVQTFTYVTMQASPEVIRAHCSAASKEDGDCGEIIIEADVGLAAQQIKSLQHCTNIHTLYLHDMKAISSIDRLLRITNCLGLLGRTPLSHLQTIKELLTLYTKLTVQIEYLSLDQDDWSQLNKFTQTEPWSRLYIKTVLQTVKDEKDVHTMDALRGKTAAIYYLEGQ